jgi:RNA polymerase sigma factor (sigma-70 family)
MAAYADACDENAFAELVARHQRMVYRVCLRMLRHHQEAEDATQAVFLVLLNKASRLTRTGELTGWLYGVARNVCLEALRKRARRQEEAMLDETEEPAVEEYRPAHEEVMPFLDEELAGLTGVLRQAVVLRYLQGYDQAEAARQAGCSKGTLASRASRGIERLRQRLAKRGVTLGGAALAGLLTSEASAAVPETLLPSILATVKTVAAGAATTGATSAAAMLAKGAMKAMFIAKMKAAAAVVAAAIAVGGAAGLAQQLAIQSFDGTGRLTFNEVSTAETYRVEWAPSPGGPWTNFTAAALAVDEIVAKGSGIVTCSVPMTGSVQMYYRVVATVTNATPPQPEGIYLVVDLSGGPSAPNYPVTYLDAVPPGGWTDEHKTTKLVLRRIPATTPNFTMGSPSDELGRWSAETQHQVTLTSDFYIGVFEVTQRQWELVMGNKPSWFTNETCYATRPVERVSYYNIRENPANVDDPAVDWPANSAVSATSFMGRLRTTTGLAGFDLPTESQWEYACRAGTTTALNSGYNLTAIVQDARMDEVGRYMFNGPNTYGQTQGVATNGGTAAVGSYLANAWGLYDMHGNVWEWCLDWHGDYPGTVSDPKGPTSGQYGSYRVMRGGGWSLEARACRSASRDGLYPDRNRSFGGFRVCCAPPGQP